MIFVFEFAVIYIYINFDDKTSFLHPPVHIVAIISDDSVFHHSKNRVIVPLSAQTPQDTMTFMKTFYTFLTILTSPIRSEDRQE